MIARSEKNTEYEEYISYKGTYLGFTFMTILYLLFFLSCVFKEKDLIKKDAILCMYMCFLSARGYSMYRCNKSKLSLYQFIIAGIVTLILTITTLYWIWVK